MMSQPHSKGRQLIGVANVLSIINGTPCLCAIPAKRSISNTFPPGLEIVSPKKHFVLGRKAASIFSSSQSGSMNVHSIPNFFNVTPKRLNVPPQMVLEVTKWSPAPHRLIIAQKLAACPEEVNTAPTPPSRAAIFLATASLVGFARRVQKYPLSSKSNRRAICSLLSYLKVVL